MTEVAERTCTLAALEDCDWYVLGFFNTAAAEAAKSPQPCPTLCALWTAAHQAPLSTGFSRQEYWSGLPFLSPSSTLGSRKYRLT